MEKEKTRTIEIPERLRRALHPWFNAYLDSDIGHVPEIDYDMEGHFIALAHLLGVDLLRANRPLPAPDEPETLEDIHTRFRDSFPGTYLLLVGGTEDDPVHMITGPHDIVARLCSVIAHDTSFFQNYRFYGSMVWVGRHRMRLVRRVPRDEAAR